MASSFFSNGLHNEGKHQFPIELTRARKGNEEERRKFIRNAFQHYQTTPIIPEDSLAEKTKQYLDKIWNDWLEYAKAFDTPLEKIWVDLCHGGETNKVAESYCQSFLRAYVEFSRVWRPSLGPNEWEVVKTVNHAVTIEDVWSALVRNADTKVLQVKRTEKFEETGQWPTELELRYSSRDRNKRDNPAYKIAQWIPTLAKEMGLSLKQSFEKRETSSEDVIILLDVLWTRAADIKCTPDVRVAFHSAVLLAAIGGWRPACLLNIKYKDVQLGWVRHLNKTHLVADITIHQNKQNENRIERTQRSTMRFSITTVPCSQICLVSLLASRAFSDRAFEAEFISPDQVLYPGPLEHGVEYVPLKWKPEVEDKGIIIPIAYNTYYKLWNRVCFVAGLREADRMRPYAMRVGTGNRLDGSLTPAVRNYILDHSTEIHEKSYLPIHVRHNIHAIAFPGLTGENSVLISLQSSALLRRDQNAPIYITQDDLDNWEKRKDMTSYREQYDENKKTNRLMARHIKERIKYLLDCLEKLRLKEMRQKYFQEVDKLRALGLSTEHLSNKNATNPRKHAPVMDALVTSRIGLLLQKNVNPEITITKVTAYLLRKPEKEIFKEEYETEPSEPQTDVKPPPETRCLICDIPYANVSSLTRHVREHHKFTKPFNCPECIRNGIVHEVNGIPSAWSNHVQKFHGKSHTPNLWSEAEKPAYCPICQKTFTVSGFSSHYNRHQKSLAFPFNCPECQRQGKSNNTAITSPDDWILHVKHAHNGGQTHGAILQANASKKRPLENDTKGREENDDTSNKRARRVVQRRKRITQ